jgi:hypothetical protein
MPGPGVAATGLTGAMPGPGLTGAMPGPGLTGMASFCATRCA